MTPIFAFDPIRKSLYSPDELLLGYNPDRPETYIESLDFEILREFIRAGGSQPDDYLVNLMRSLHDATLTQHLADALTGKLAVSIMGGHGLARSTSGAYADTAKIAQGLARNGLLVLSGGGPGAMEACHLGAMFANDDSGLSNALGQLASSGQTTLPKDQFKVVGPDGTPNPTVVAEYAKWTKPAIDIWKSNGCRGGGISVPTYQYGQEPFSPFASKIAKYFQNSIREDGLLAVSTQGIVYVQGGAGTLQEVFQDVAQNFYHSFPAKQGSGYFSPMVFFGSVWTNERPIKPVLDSLFAGSDQAREYSERVLFTTSVEQSVQFLSDFKAPHANNTITNLSQRISLREDMLGKLSDFQ